jgi:hypothetical protein
MAYAMGFILSPLRGLGVISEYASAVLAGLSSTAKPLFCGRNQAFFNPIIASFRLWSDGGVVIQITIKCD